MTRCRFTTMTFLLVLALVLAPATAHAQLYAAVLPSACAVQVGTPATAFATIINAGSSTAVGCTIAPATPVDATFGYQTTNPATNEPIGTPNTPVDIPAGGSQSFVLALTPQSAFESTPIEFTFDCTNTAPAGSLLDVNTLRLAAGPSFGSVLAIAATMSGGGVVEVPEAGFAAFSVAVVNVNSANVATPVTFPRVYLNTSAPVAALFCETNPTTGACVTGLFSATTPGSGYVRPIAISEVVTFSVFLQRTGSVPFDPATQRISMLFIARNAIGGGNSSLYGSTSVAVRTQP